MTGRVMFDIRHAIFTYARCRLGLTSPSKALEKWLRDDVPKVPRYAGFHGRLTDLPIVEKADLMADFAAFNTAGITAEMGWTAFEGSRMIGRYVVGASTGTSGNRGLFVISQAERFRWLGAILAKALPGFWMQNHRVAVVLPLNTPLYDSANRLSRLHLKFIDINSDWAAEVAVYDPTVLIAPPKILRALAEQGSRIAPGHIFAAAEPLDPLDRTAIEAHFQTTLRQIYMATEGLLAVSCAHGTLHLCEDTMHFELPQVGEDPDLREIIISDFSRQTQIMARYRMNDLVRLRQTPCACGSPHRALAEVVGRADDCFVLGEDAAMITPDLIRNAVVDSNRQITDFRVIQTGARAVMLHLEPSIDPEPTRQALAALFQRYAEGVEIVVVRGPMPLETGRKLRRVENRHAR